MNAYEMWIYRMPEALLDGPVNTRHRRNLNYQLIVGPLQDCNVFFLIFQIHFSNMGIIAPSVHFITNFENFHYRTSLIT